jgi:hypothetical protein
MLHIFDTVISLQRRRYEMSVEIKEHFECLDTVMLFILHFSFFNEKTAVPCISALAKVRRQQSFPVCRCDI